jgi:hypothetical protein
MWQGVTHFSAGMFFFYFALTCTPLATRLLTYVVTLADFIPHPFCVNTIDEYVKCL